MGYSYIIALALGIEERALNVENSLSSEIRTN